MATYSKLRLIWAEKNTPPNTSKTKATKQSKFSTNFRGKPRLKPPTAGKRVGLSMIHHFRTGEMDCRRNISNKIA